MRKMWLTLVLIGLLVLPLLAQRGGRGQQQGGGDFLLRNKSVQEELKLDEKQKKELAAIGEKQTENMKKVFELFKEGEKEKAMETGKKFFEETTKALAKIRESLTPTQHKRFTQIQIQQAVEKKSPAIFINKDVEKLLALSDKQKEKIKETLADLEKDVKEVMDEAGPGFTKKRQAAQKKAAGLRRDVYEKIAKSFTEDQAKVWKTAGGEKFELKVEKTENPFFKKKKKEKKDE